QHSPSPPVSTEGRIATLRTATQLARSLPEIREETDGPGYFATLNARQVLPTTRVEYALRGDELLTESDVRELMQTYIAVRSRRGRMGNGNGLPGGHETDQELTSGT